MWADQRNRLLTTYKTVFGKNLRGGKPDTYHLQGEVL
jgi:hypothetical protein